MPNSSKPQLDVGEALLWSGRPRQGIVFRPIEWLLVPFSMLWCGFALFWEYSVLFGIGGKGGGSAPIIFPLFGIPFVVLGLYVLIGRFIADKYHRQHLHYALTNRRAIISSRAFSRSTVSIELNDVRGLQLDEVGADRGTIHLTEQPSFAFNSAINGFAIWHATLGQPPPLLPNRERQKSLRSGTSGKTNSAHLSRPPRPLSRAKQTGFAAALLAEIAAAAFGHVDVEVVLVGEIGFGPQGRAEDLAGGVVGVAQELRLAALRYPVGRGGIRTLGG